MKRLSLFIAFLFVVALGAAGCGVRAAARTRPAAPAQRVVVDVSVFYDELAPYGRWFSLDGYGWVWTTYGVSAGWRPYTDGPRAAPGRNAEANAQSDRRTNSPSRRDRTTPARNTASARTPGVGKPAANRTDATAAQGAA